MKTALKAKLLIETDQARQYYEGGIKPEFSYMYLEKLIKSGKYTLEIVTDLYTNSYEPILIIKEKVYLWV